MPIFIIFEYPTSSIPMVKQLFRLFLLLLIPFNGWATHIVGGELNYKWLGGNKYAISMTVYRDCYNGIPPFDNPAALGIFDVNNVLIDTLMMTLRSQDTLPNTISNNPCFVPPRNVCYERTTYLDTVILPPRAGGYQLVYQRCCRNATILNIIAPNNTGATYYAHIPDQALVHIDSNPKFNNWPPPFLCANVPFVFDHSATDYDGDSLVYSLFQPYDGASSTVPMPQPPNNPPYPLIVWATGYSVANMMGGVPLTINSHTGLLTATPNTIGQFVVGMRCQEYRNHVLIGETRRDYQFNVVACPTLVVAALQAPSVICGSNTVNFQNNSNGASSYYWNFGDHTNPGDTSHATLPSYTYPDTGSYNTMLVAYSSISRACNDTSRYTVHIRSAYKSSFTFTPEPCKARVIDFFGTTTDNSHDTPSWMWNFGDATTSTLQNPTHTFLGGGNYSITLISSIPNSLHCSDTVSSKVISVAAGSNLFIPNTFTPNGDGNNDEFRVRGPVYENFYFAVYNRWGQKVFETTDQTVGWDGTFNGVMADPGVFAYYMKAQCGTQPAVFEKGNVTLIR
jgi:gliding motility-associated-like protein